ncbi:uncharacterized protein A4U43_C01F11530 [Asparagus officinalis]|uniref:Uncharacterized protein n=2 Tax=Asparagus officinalis TaxID=4686 RepID=A0A5P1FNU2_ASPOF|nr:uncharacterized protein A4U43_C01F11530 [Asparagus officinalis]
MKHSRFLLTGARLSAAPLSEKSINVEKSSVMIGNNNENSSSSSSSISEYLTKTIPGYRVEDLLVDDTYELHKSEEMVPLSESELVVAELPIWVPQIQTLQSFGHCDYGFGVKGLDQNQQCYDALKGIGEQWSTDDSFMVPQINTPPSSSNKRPRVSSAWDF